MNSRILVPENVIAKVGRDVMKKLAERLVQHGPGSFIGAHEVLGILTEEWKELIDAVQANDCTQVEKELIDIAVACVFGVASSRLWPN